MHIGNGRRTNKAQNTSEGSIRNLEKRHEIKRNTKGQVAPFNFASAKPSSFLLPIIIIICYHEPLSEVYGGASVQSLVSVGVQVQERLEHVEHARHLRKEQHAVAASLQVAKQRG